MSRLNIKDEFVIPNQILEGRVASGEGVRSGDHHVPHEDVEKFLVLPRYVSAICGVEGDQVKREEGDKLFSKDYLPAARNPQNTEARKELLMSGLAKLLFDKIAGSVDHEGWGDNFYDHLISSGETFLHISDDELSSLGVAIRPGKKQNEILRGWIASDLPSKLLGLLRELEVQGNKPFEGKSLSTVTMVNTYFITINLNLRVTQPTS